MYFATWSPVRSTSHLQIVSRICLTNSYLACTGIHYPDTLTVSVTPSFIRGYWNINQLSISYALRPRLRSRLTQGGRTFPWKPWSIGVLDSHQHLATHTGILTSNRSTTPYGIASTQLERSPTQYLSYCQSFGILLSPGKFSAQGHSTSELLRTL